MGNFAIVALMTSALFLAMILQLAAKPRFAGRLTAVFIALAAFFGLAIYSYGYTFNSDSLAVAIIRALLAVCGMFVAKMDFSVVQGLPPFDQEWGKVVFWVVHWFALYATASAAITTVGAEALQKLRLYMARWGEMNLIYGANGDSLEFGKELMRSQKCAVVYVDSKPEAAYMTAISKAGCVLRSDDSAVNADVKFLKSIGIRRGKRKINLYALSKDASENLRYAKAFLESARECDISPRQISLVIPGQENSNISRLQVLGDRYGYGYVTVFQEAGLAARLLVQTYPPCDSIRFDAQGRAEEDFEALVVGFGHMGQMVLRQLVMNGQFAGSTFRAAVFAPDCESVSGHFARCYDEVLAHYDISFHPYDARSKQMYDYILERREKLKYAVLCTGSDKINREIAEDMKEFFQRLGLQIPIYQCSYRGIRGSEGEGNITKQYKLYQPKVLSMSKLDRMAMVINHHYRADSEGTALDDWMECDYFSRMSSRASADFIPAILRAAGKTAEQAADGDWKLSKAQLENLSETEHMRWCAFHYCMGFSPMSEAEYDSRAQEYLRQIAQNGKASVRIGKNMQQRTHACLVNWDKLDALSAKEYKITGKNVDYKALDMENVLIVPKLLKIGREAEEQNEAKKL